ncbi:hypothetical protein J7E87_03715 [Streptomyces sp. ISL-1]|uniref:hypothetical protein n=1 Tax=Streptomyces sp. ISL-1 TaxID=2817657 RepID=UPI001BE78311|nr:hypothetical protein [Streptomyces sp. ISL-1]MBT2388544.1 hypothetical protein [Streptomyces sp. ISL-1]
MFSAIPACSRADPYAEEVLYERRATNHHTVARISTASRAIEALRTLHGGAAQWRSPSAEASSVGPR